MSENAEYRGDSNMIQARSECSVGSFETLFHSRVDVNAGPRSIMEQEALGNKENVFQVRSVKIECHDRKV
jgi:hypothetical protein